MTGQNPTRAFRSFLFAPANHARRAEKVFLAGADAVVLDLEDAVPHADKAAARALAVEALRRPRNVPGYVRVNAYTTAWCWDDLLATAGPWLDGVVVPKAESPATLQSVDWVLAQLERVRGMPAGTLDLMPIVETAAGIEALPGLACACARVRRLAFGGADYTADLGLAWSAGEDELAYARARLVHASRAAGLEPPIDTVVTQVRDADRCRASAQRARALGFGGKLCIHPDQVPIVHAAFTPDAAELDRARRIIDAFEVAETSGSASIQLDGEFVDYPVVERARRVLALARH